MTEREKIIRLAKETLSKDVIYYRDGIEMEWNDLAIFYHAAQVEAYEKVLDLKPTAFHIFGLGAQLPQGETRDVIEWYDASIRNLKEQA